MKYGLRGEPWEGRPIASTRAAFAVIVAVGLSAARLMGQGDLAAIHGAAEQGDAEAQLRLGVMYANGEGVLKDPAEAIRWYRLAAEQGHASAQYNLGVMYANGQGGPQDFLLAHMWFNIAGSNGSVEAGKERDKLEKSGGGFWGISTRTSAEIKRATELARTCRDSDYRECTRRGMVEFTKAALFKVEDVGVTAPALTSETTPAYSEEALNARVEGVVGIEAVVHTNGSLEVLRVVRSLGFGLDERALEAVRQWKFQPGKLRGKPVAIKVAIEITFNLR